MTGLVEYWDRRYAAGKGSGEGSRGDAAQDKADLVHAALRDVGGSSVADFGCGDGVVASLLDVAAYVGVDVSETAITTCVAETGRRPGWAWLLVDPSRPPPVKVWADVALSFDVIFHLDDDHLSWHLAAVFDSAASTVLVRATNYDAPRSGHMHHHRWRQRVPGGWRETMRPPDDTETGFWRFDR